jgi:tetratricopeptide (TPR) repeat protein
MIRKLLNAIRAALLFTRALDRASKGRYEDGLACLAEVEKLQINHFEYDLLGGVLANRTGRHQLALALFRRAKDGIQIERKLSQPTRDYPPVLRCLLRSRILKVDGAKFDHRLGSFA